MINRKYKTKIMLLVLSILLMFFARESFAANGSFYNQDNMYRGFYWFEEPEEKPKRKEKNILTSFAKISVACGRAG